MEKLIYINQEKLIKPAGRRALNRIILVEYAPHADFFQSTAVPRSRGTFFYGHIPPNEIYSRQMRCLPLISPGVTFFLLIIIYDYCEIASRRPTALFTFIKINETIYQRYRNYSPCYYSIQMRELAIKLEEYQPHLT